MKIVCISDTHGYKPSLPSGDVLIHAGDMCSYGTISELIKTLEWLNDLPYKYKVTCMGNHDICAEKDPDLVQQYCKDYGVIWLNNSSCTIDGYEFYGSPVTPTFGNWSFMEDRNSDRIKRTWADIPDNTEILITHSPAKFTLDSVESLFFDVYRFEYVGCEDLQKRIESLPLLKAHVFGHVHEHGCSLLQQQSGYVSINASVCDPRYTLWNKPIVTFELEDKK